MLKVAALFVQSNGVYMQDYSIDAYDEKRNALTYVGNLPVVAHPPCQLWGKMAKINYKRWGGEHNKPGNDGGMFKFALSQVNRCGGVLEHPAQSYAWKAHGLKRPIFGSWIQCGKGWVTEVWQCDYGHKARKSTWLYYKGRKPFDLKWLKSEWSHQIGGFDQRGKQRNKPTVSKKEASATPVEFKKELINLAIYSGLKND